MYKCYENFWYAVEKSVKGYRFLLHVLAIWCFLLYSFVNLWLGVKLKLFIWSLFSFKENGYQNVRFHVVANLHNFTVEEETKIRQTVASIVGCCIEQIRVHGYLRSTSFFIVLSIKTSYIERLLAMKQCDKDRLSKLHIDYFMVDFNTISLGRTTGFVNDVFFSNKFVMFIWQHFFAYESKFQIKIKKK